MPTDPTMTAVPAAGADTSAEGAEPAESGYKICIAVDGAGKISVGVENEGGAAGEPADGSDSGSEDEDAEMGAMQPASSIKEALTMALEIYKADGQVPSSSADDDFASGFAGRGGSNAS